ncbi:Signal transduction histidine kinase [Seinonella peptonophila]|uniref:histidine kinase n=1 Tax=Seinonella peptonophila TaxID=112248 RepID=A0A1M4VGN5_9BACL|nr:HAMP domain-containing sensor histidine kinase [Seinonella peptonophila]SHE68149.1 Signal transduction histidine kinase [Seinonella peptonophila]
MSKLHFRIGIHIFFIVSLLFTMIVVIGITSIIIIDKGKTLIGLEKGQGDLFFMLTFFSGILLFCGWYVWFLGKPLIHLMLWISNLANNHYQYPSDMKKFYQRNGKLKIHFRLYEDVFTHMHKLTQVLQKNQREQERIDQLKKDWGAGISHDLKTPLTYITSYSSMYLSAQYVWSNQEKRDFVQRIQQKSMLLEELIDDLNISFQLEDSEIPLNTDTYNIIEFVRRIIVDIANDPLSKEHCFQFEVKQGQIDIDFDPKLLKRILYNLIMNAVLHNPPKTTICIHIYQADCLYITIKDNGIGMNEETKKHLFDKYYRAKTTLRSIKGTGLGMAISKQLILAHNGNIEVTSQQGQGTTISISLPLKQ